MTSLERVVAVLNHQEPDHVPAYPLCNSISRIYTGIDYAEWTLNEEKCAESIIKATEELGLDVICSLVDLSVEAADWDALPDRRRCWPGYEGALHHQARGL